ncbi:MAG: hypothetical protein ACTSSH_00385 [Candidatus Heimdallarchaeota archaeon]
MTLKTANDFAKLLIMRGFGLYGDNRMMKICVDSGITCETDGSFTPIHEDNMEIIIEQLIVNYAKFNLPAKMTSLVLAKKYGIPIPDELRTSSSKKSKYRQKLEM